MFYALMIACDNTNWVMDAGGRFSNMLEHAQLLMPFNEKPEVNQQELQKLIPDRIMFTAPIPWTLAVPLLDANHTGGEL